MFRLLVLLQLTRAALAFTAIADAWTVLLLHLPGEAQQSMTLIIVRMLVTCIVSFGLYGFGMALNDLLDARRDRIFAPRRPIPSGRIEPRSAIVISLSLLIAALIAAALLTPLYVVGKPDLHPRDFVPYSLLFAAVTAALIVFYDAAAKYLGGVGLITLGAIRALHCLIGNPKSPLMFLSMILLTHVVIVSTFGYVLEGKRPRLRRGDFGFIIFGLLVGNGLSIWYMATRRVNVFTYDTLLMLIGPAIAAAVFLAWAIAVLRSKSLTPRKRGDLIVLMGLFWLFIYDASILVANRQYLAGIAITLLLLCAVGSFFAIRYLSRTAGQPRLSYRPERNLTKAG
ncbi:MAG TPA: UbiA family prenyltransferase [Phycisphaerae bacterium]|nr:UbiA family prenyltransferase [Phycisphaerae bacterium]